MKHGKSAPFSKNSNGGEADSEFISSNIIDILTPNSLRITSFFIHATMCFLPILSIRIPETPLHLPLLIVDLTWPSFQQKPSFRRPLHCRIRAFRIFKFNIPKPLQFLRLIIPSQPHTTFYNLSTGAKYLLDILLIYSSIGHIPDENGPTSFGLISRLSITSSPTTIFGCLDV